MDDHRAVVFFGKHLKVEGTRDLHPFTGKEDGAHIVESACYVCLSRIRLGSDGNIASRCCDVLTMQGGLGVMMVA